MIGPTCTGEGIQGIQVFEVELVAQILHPCFQRQALGESHPPSQAEGGESGGGRLQPRDRHPVLRPDVAHFEFSKEGSRAAGVTQPRADFKGRNAEDGFIDAHDCQGLLDVVGQGVSALNSELQSIRYLRAVRLTLVLNSFRSRGPEVWALKKLDGRAASAWTASNRRAAAIPQFSPALEEVR